MRAIPENINSFSQADAYRYYRDVVGLHVYPVYPPGADVKDAGKQPAIPKLVGRRSAGLQHREIFQPSAPV